MWQDHDHIVIRGKVYKVVSQGPVHLLQTGDNVYACCTDPPGCTCPQGTYGGQCKHVVALQEFLPTRPEKIVAAT